MSKHFFGKNIELLEILKFLDINYESDVRKNFMIGYLSFLDNKNKILKHKIVN